MNGIKYLKVYNNKGIIYELFIRRKITIISDNSGTGKSTLIDMIEKANIGAGASLKCDCACKVLIDRYWEQDLTEWTDTIVFIDENFEAVNTKEFAEAVNNSDNYFVIINREKLDNLSFSYKEIYAIKASGKFHSLEQKYTEFRGNNPTVSEQTLEATTVRNRLKELRK